MDKEEEILFSKNTIFHYTSRRIFLEYILPNMQIKLSSYGKTNDPAEYKDLTFTGKGRLSESPNAHINNSVLRDKLNEEIQEKIKIACFCRNKDAENIDITSSGYTKSRMWSQYGNDHSGVCLVIDRKKLKENIRNIIGEDKYFQDKDVSYSNNPTVSIESRTIDNAKAEQLAQDVYIREHIIKHFEGLFFNKNPDYKDEDEYRFVVYTNKPENLFIPIKDSLIGVIVGDRFPTIYACVVEELSKNYNILCKRLKWHNGKPKLSDDLWINV